MKTIINVFIILNILIIFNYTYASQIKYNFDYIENNDSFKIILEFTGSQTGKTKIYMPCYVWDVDLSDKIKNIKIISDPKESSLILDKKNNLAYIIHKPNSLLKVSYELHNFCTEENLSNTTIYNPSYINKGNFFINGKFGLIIPSSENFILKDNTYSILFKWNNFKGPIFSNLGNIEENVLKTKIKEKELHESFFIGGKLKIYPLLNGIDYGFVITQGNLPAIKNTIIPRLNSLINFQNKFFNSPPKKEYFLFMSRKVCKFCIGGNHQNNFQLIFLSEHNNNLKEIIKVVAHERLHKWFGGFLKHGSQENYNKWFLEGFTDYYTYYLNYLNGIIDFEEYLKSYNDCLEEYFSLPTVYATNEVIANNFWKGEVFERLPYLRGRIFAYELDNKIKEKTKDRMCLDDVIKYMIKISYNKDIEFSTEFFIETLKTFTSLDISQLLCEQITLGKTLIKSKSFLGKAILSNKKITIPDYGFDFVKSFENQKIVNVKKNSNAYKAGIRNGDKFYGAYLNGINKNTFLEIEKNNLTKTIVYRPEIINIKIPIYIMAK